MNLLARIVVLAALGSSSVAAQPLPLVDEGRIERLHAVPSKHVDPRHVDVWIPEACSTTTPCQVLYMHDGQMLFDASTTWNRQAWDVHRTVGRLMREGRIAPTLVVGIWNNGPRRHSEFYPQKALAHLPALERELFVGELLQGAPRSDAYLRFIVQELKPLIDARFATRPGRESTFVMGSSMGGMISVYAFGEYPQVFGGAAALSTHWVGRWQPNALLPLAAFNHLQAWLPPPDGRRLYMDHGSTELDALYGPYQRFVDEIVRDKGYGPTQYLSRVFEGTGHNERAWAARLEVPLLFLMGRR